MRGLDEQARLALFDWATCSPRSSEFRGVLAGARLARESRVVLESDDVRGFNAGFPNVVQVRNGWAVGSISIEFELNPDGNLDAFLPWGVCS